MFLIIIINGVNLVDLAGNNLDKNYTFFFTTRTIDSQSENDSDNDSVLDEDDYGPLDPNVIKKPAETNWLLWIGLIVIIIAAVIGLLLFRKNHLKLRNPRGPSES